VVVGWGTASHTTAFDSTGEMLFDVGLPKGTFSYRGLWLPWRSAPKHPPALAVGRDEHSGAKLVYASWNGATDVAGWQIDAGASTAGLRPVGIAKRRGFETVVPLDSGARFAAVTAVDRSGSALAPTRMIRL
jgi:hypothetical protein